MPLQQRSYTQQKCIAYVGIHLVDFLYAQNQTSRLLQQLREKKKFRLCCNMSSDQQCEIISDIPVPHIPNNLLLNCPIKPRHLEYVALDR